MNKILPQSIFCTYILRCTS